MGVDDGADMAKPNPPAKEDPKTAAQPEMLSVPHDVVKAAAMPRLKDVQPTQPSKAQPSMEIRRLR